MCSYCLRDICPSSCPNYVPPKPSHYCSACEEGIYKGDEYITNDNGDYMHYDCICGTSSLLEWLGHEIKTMEESDE